MVAHQSVLLSSLLACDSILPEQEVELLDIGEFRICAKPLVKGRPKYVPEHSVFDESSHLLLKAGIHGNEPTNAILARLM